MRRLHDLVSVESLWPNVEDVQAKIGSRQSTTGSNIPGILFDAGYHDSREVENDALYTYYRDRHTYFILHYYSEKKKLSSKMVRTHASPISPSVESSARSLAIAAASTS